MSLNQLTIYGAGLIGGSIALAARQQGFCQRLVAIDVALPETSFQQQIFDDWAISESEQIRALERSDLTVLCLPVRAIIDELPRVLAHTTGVVTDCGSTKAAIGHSVQDHPGRARFVAGHPMAGHPQGGLINASHALFHERRWILCPEQSSLEAIELVESLVRATGAEIVHLKDIVHDASVAWTSHVPQVVASTLSVHAHLHGALPAAGPGFASATRVAGGAEAMWADIFGTNAEEIGNSLVEVGQVLSQLGTELQAGSVQGALEVLAQARALRSAPQK